jgi:hypothetical protein
LPLRLLLRTDAPEYGLPDEHGETGGPIGPPVTIETLRVPARTALVLGT